MTCGFAKMVVRRFFSGIGTVCICHSSLREGYRGVPSYHGSGVLNICGMITFVSRHINEQLARNL